MEENIPEAKEYDSNDSNNINVPIAPIMCEVQDDNNNSIWVQEIVPDNIVELIPHNKKNNILDSRLKIFIVFNLFISYLYSFYTYYSFVSMLLSIYGFLSIIRKKKIHIYLFTVFSIVQLTFRSFAFILNIIIYLDTLFIIISILGMFSDFVSCIYLKNILKSY